MNRRNDRNKDNVEYKNDICSMRKSLLLFASAILFCGSAMAQVDNTLQFVDASGNVVEDGATVNGVVKYVNIGGGLGYYQIDTGLRIKNTTNEVLGASLSGRVTRIDNGQFQCCYPTTCKSPLTSPGVFSSDPGALYVGADPVSLSTHWEPTAYGECTATIKLLVYDAKLNDFGLATDFTLRGDGPSVTVNFVYGESSTDISEIVTEETDKIVERYALDGRILSAPEKGLNIVRYANGKIAKVFVK